MKYKVHISYISIIVFIIFAHVQLSGSNNNKTMVQSDIANEIDSKIVSPNSQNKLSFEQSCDKKNSYSEIIVSSTDVKKINYNDVTQQPEHVLDFINQLFGDEAEGILQFNEQDISDRIAEKLLFSSFDEHDKLDYIDNYLTDFRSHVNTDFVNSILEEGYFYTLAEQLELLEIMQSQVLANRGSRRDDIQESILYGVSAYSNHSDERVRLAALKIIATAHEDNVISDEVIAYYLSDPSEVVRAYATVLMYKTQL